MPLAPRENYTVIKEQLSDPDGVEGLCNYAEMYYLATLSYCFLQTDDESLQNRLAVGTFEDGSTCTMLLKKTENSVPSLGEAYFGVETAWIFDTEAETRELEDAILISVSDKDFQFGRTMDHFNSKLLLELSEKAKGGSLSSSDGWMYKQIKKAAEKLGMDTTNDFTEEWYKELFQKLKHYVLEKTK